MPNGTYGGVRGKETKVGQKNFRFPTYSIGKLKYVAKYNNAKMIDAQCSIKYG